MNPVVPPFVRKAGFGTLGESFVEPTPAQAVPLGPATVGAWLTLGLGLFLALGLLTSLAARYRRRRYRRQARRELALLERAWTQARGAERLQHVERLTVVLKACALGSFERRDVARLAGADWIAFLNRTSPKAPFAEPTGDALVTVCTRGAQSLPDEQCPALFAAARSWIESHQAAPRRSRA